MEHGVLDAVGFARREHHVHAHVHGALDPGLATTTRGIWAIKWSFVALAVAAALQFAVVAASGSVALLSDAIHNLGDAATAAPLWIAFMFARRKADSRFTYGYGRVEDLAGAVVVLIIFSSAIVAMLQALDRLVHPHPVEHLWAIAIAGVVGFTGNEIAAILRVRAGRQISSAALIADGYHARADGLTSLAVVAGTVGVWLGFPLADPIVGLIIAATIVLVIWQSAGTVFVRLLDAVEPSVIAEIRHVGEQVPGVREVLGTRARWLGHHLYAQTDIAIDTTLCVREGIELADRFKTELIKHLPALALVHIGIAEQHDTAVVKDATRGTA